MADRYQQRLKVHLDESWAEWLNGMRIKQRPDGTMTITRNGADQAALLGLLRRIRDLVMPLISFNLLEFAPALPLKTMLEADNR